MALKKKRKAGAAKKVVRKIARKTAKKAARKKTAKKITRKVAKKITKKITKKVARKKAGKKIAKKVAKKIAKKKVAKKVAKKRAVSKKSIKKKAVSPSPVDRLERDAAIKRYKERVSQGEESGGLTSLTLDEDDLADEMLYADDDLEEKLNDQGEEGDKKEMEAEWASRTMPMDKEYNPDDEKTDDEDGEFGYGWDYEDALDFDEESSDDSDLMDEDEAYAKGLKN